MEIIIIGGGLAGSEAAWQAAIRGVTIKLYEMRPVLSTGAHKTSKLAELVCSNSLGSNLINRASGLLKEELRHFNSMLLECAESTALPAGGALAVDREAFSDLVTKRISQQKRITLLREEITEIPDAPTIIASGPLTSNQLTQSIQNLTGHKNLFFFDAIAPIIIYDSIDMSIAFRGSRYNRGEQSDGDYINLPLSKNEYDSFVNSLKSAKCARLREFETEISHGVLAGSNKYFEGCLPIEILAKRGDNTLAFGPMRPVGIINPHTGKRPYAVIQLRQDNLAGSLYNMVGFQTNLTFSEQKRIFRMIPGLERAKFLRYGQMHRNTFIASPLLIKPTLQFKLRNNLFFAGQIIGIEGYIGNIASGLLAGINAARFVQGKPPIVIPKNTMLGSLCEYITNADINHFQPMKANFSILPPLTKKVQRKRERAVLYGQRALNDLDEFLLGQSIK